MTEDEKPEGYDEYVAANALVVVRQRDATIARLRKEVAKLLGANKSLRLENARLRETVDRIVGDGIDRLFPPDPWMPWLRLLPWLPLAAIAVAGAAYAIRFGMKG